MATMTSQTHSVVTNLADITGPMRVALNALDPNGTPTILHRTVGDALVSRGLATKHDDNHFVITHAGARVRDLAEREHAELIAPTVAPRSLGSYGWAMLAENDFGGHAITTWTRDEHTLVLSWIGAYEVSAAIYDGAPLPLDELVQTVMVEQPDLAPETLLEMAANRALTVANPYHARELSALLSELARETRVVPEHIARPIRTAAGLLVVAILATPHAR